MDGRPSVTTGRRRVSALALVLVVLVLLAIPVLVITVARGGLPLIGLLVSALILAPVAWILVFGRR